MSRLGGGGSELRVPSALPGAFDRPGAGSDAISDAGGTIMRCVNLNYHPRNLARDDGRY